MENPELGGLGTHCVADLYGCPRHLLNDVAFITKTLRDAVDQGLATLIKEVHHQFTPQGVTALGLLAESHISIHTWPEIGFVGADVFTCGERASAEIACRYLIHAFRPQTHSLRRFVRGAEYEAEESDGAANECCCETTAAGAI